MNFTRDWTHLGSPVPDAKPETAWTRHAGFAGIASLVDAIPDAKPETIWTRHAGFAGIAFENRLQAAGLRARPRAETISCIGASRSTGPMAESVGGVPKNRRPERSVSRSAVIPSRRSIISRFEMGRP